MTADRTVEEVLDRVYGITKVLVVLVIVLFVTVGALTWQVTASNHRINKVQTAANDAKAAGQDAKTAAEAANQTLTAAISGSGDAPTGAETRAAIDAIYRIEHHLCGGACPS